MKYRVYLLISLPVIALVFFLAKVSISQIPASTNTTEIAQPAVIAQAPIVPQTSDDIPAYMPPTYILGAPLNRPVSFDVDEFGRIYVVDPGRFAIMVFGTDGKLEASWHNDDFGEDKWVVRDFINVVSSDLIFLSGQSTENPWKSLNVLRISPYEPDGISVMPDGQHCGPVFGLPDRSYFELYSEDEIKFMDYQGNEFTQAKPGFRIERYYSPGGVDSMGNLYIFDKFNSNIQIWSRRGEKLRQVAIPCKENEYRNTLFDQIVVDNTDIVYAQNDFAIFRLDALGNRVFSFTPYIDPREHPKDTYFRPSIFRIKVRNGIIYAMLDWSMTGSPQDIHEIQAYTADGRCIARYLCPKQTINSPNAIAVQPDRSYAVGQYQNWTGNGGGIFDANGKQTGGIGGYSFIEKLYASDNQTYLSTNSYSFERIDSSGKAVEIISKAEGQGMSSTWKNLDDKLVSAICHYPPGNNMCYLTWHMVPSEMGMRDGDGELRIINNSGRIINTIPVPYTVTQGIAADSNGDIYIVYGEPGYSRIFKIDSQGNQLYEKKDEGWQLGQIQNPECILVDNNDNLLVLDTGNSRIQVFDPDGKPLGVWGKLGNGDGELNHPRAMCFGPGNTLWIADTRNDRIVTIPVQRLWKELTHKVNPPPAPVMLARRESLPKPGMVTLEGTVTADASDGALYAQHSTGSWGVRLQVPEGVSITRGKSYRISGKLDAKKNDYILTAKTAKLVKKENLRPLELANAAISRSDKNHNVPNGVLVTTWGRVISTDKTRKTFTISDGSLGKNGIKVTCGKRITDALPAKSGQYIVLTGISIRNSLHIREASDIRNLGLIKSAKQQLSMVR